MNSRTALMMGLALGLLAITSQVGLAVPVPSGQLGTTVTMNIGTDSGAGANNAYNPRSFDSKNYVVQVTSLAIARYPAGSGTKEAAVSLTSGEVQMIAPFRGAYASQYVLAAGGSSSDYFSRFNYDTMGRTTRVFDSNSANQAASFDWIDNTTIIYCSNYSGLRTKLYKAIVTANPFSVIDNLTWNTPASVRIRNVRIGNVYKGYAYFGDSNNANPGFWAINLDNGTCTSLGSLSSITGSSNWGLWTVKEVDGYLYLQTTNNGIWVYNMTNATTLGTLYTYYTKSELDNLTGGLSSQAYWGFDVVDGGARMLMSAGSGKAIEIQSWTGIGLTKPANAAIIAGGTATFGATITNTKPTGGANLNYSLSATSSQAGTVISPLFYTGTLSPGASDTRNFSVTSTTVGNETITLTADDDNASAAPQTTSATLTVYDHSDAVFAASNVDNLTLDFGEVIRNSNPAALTYAIKNALGQRVALKFDGRISATGDTNVFTVTDPAFTNLSAGSTSPAYSVALNTGTSGQFEATYVFGLSDNSSVSGAQGANAQQLTLTVRGKVTTTLTGTVNLLDYIGTVAGVRATVELIQGGQIVRTDNVTLNSNGGFTIKDIVPGTYDVRVKPSHWLATRVNGVSITDAATMQPVTVTNGDCDGDNAITSEDLSIVLDAMDSVSGDSNWDSRADLDGDGMVTSSDTAIILRNTDSPMITGMAQLADYAVAPTGQLVILEFRPAGQSNVVWNPSVSLDANGNFAVDNSLTPGTYDVTVQGTHWLKAVMVRGIAIGTGSADLGTVTLTNGDADGDNEITSTDASIILAAMDTTDPQADLNGDGQVNAADLSIVLAHMDQIGE